VPTRLSLSVESATLASLGETKQFVATVSDQRGSPIAGAAVSWSSSDSSVATVSSSGLVAAVKNGTAMVTATSGLLNAGASVLVRQVATTVELRPGSLVLEQPGAAASLAAEARDALGSSIADPDFSWRSANVKVVWIAEGVATGISVGATEVYAEVDAARGTASVRVEPRPGDVTLEVGDVWYLDAATFTLSPIEGAGYALAYLDPRALRAARIGPETEPDPSWFDVTVRSTGGTAAPRSTAAAWQTPTFVPLDAQPLESTSTDCSPRLVDCPDTPWMEGDTLAYAPRSGDPVEQKMVVVRATEGLVIVVPESAADTLAPAGVDRLDAVLGVISTSAVPAWTAALSPNRPRSNPHTGQFVVALVEQPCSTMGCFMPSQAAPGVEPTGAVEMSLGAAWPELEVLYPVLIHELSHAWQFLYLWESRPAGSSDLVPPPGKWALEGNADQMTAEASRRFLGLDPAGNLLHGDRSDALHTAATNVYFNGLRSAGSFNGGYQQSAGFLQDLVVRRLVQGGDDYDHALREVAQGALESWFEYGGTPSQPVPRKGLTARMRENLGPGWEPEEALLLWSLSMAVDDLSPNPLLQIRSFENYGLAGNWTHGEAMFQAGTSASFTIIPRLYGGTGFFNILDDAVGGTFEVEASIGDVVWVLTRYR